MTQLVCLQGNHFNEYAGFECDYGRYPDAQRASHFLRHYLSEAEGCEPVRMLDTPEMQMQTWNYWILAAGPDNDIGRCCS